MTRQKPKLKIIPSIIAPMKMKCFSIYVTKHVEDKYTENYKLMKEIKDLNIETYILCLLIGKVKIIKISTLFKLIHRFKVISSKISTKFLVDIEKPTLKFTLKCTGHEIVKIKFYLDRKRINERITLPDIY